MRISFSISFAAALLSSAVTAAPPQAPRPGCGTSPATAMRARLLHALPRPSGRAAMATAAPKVRVEDGMFVVRSGPETLLNDHPIDLRNSSLVFTPAGATDYTVTRTELRYDSDRGQLVRSFDGDSARFHRHDLQNFAFPFFGQDQRTLYLSASNGISFTPPSLSQAEQFDTLEIASFGPEVISPLLLTESIPYELPYPDLYLRETAEALLVSWVVPPRDRFGYDIQAALRKSGEVIFSYREIRSLSWGTPVLSPGRAVWQRPAMLASMDDPLNDVDLLTAEAFRPRVDIRSATLRRMNDSDLLELRIQMAAPITPDSLPADNALRYLAAIGNLDSEDDFTFAGVDLRSDGSTWVYHPGRFMRNSDAARIEGDTVILSLLQGPLGVESTELALLVLTGLADAEDAADLAMTDLVLEPPRRSLALDLSSAQATAAGAFGFEAFTVPSLDVFSVWEQLQGAFALADESVDAVAIYQTFFTDIIFYASAYALFGNPQADGVALRFDYGTDSPRFPTLLHMNVLDYSWNENSKDSGHILLHEFGHRWLYGFRIREGASNTRSLNPVTDHPAQYVHTPAAFRLYSPDDSSVMGGATFRDNANGTFSSGEFSPYGYSWTDLYLMGLGAPHEVAPWFYIADSNPPLGDQYYPPPGIRVSGVRRDVALQQVVEAMGPRTPAFEQSQKSFRVLFVLLTRGDEEATAQQLTAVRDHRRVLEDAFRKATGNRGSVTTNFVKPSRQRGVRR